MTALQILLAEQEDILAQHRTHLLESAGYRVQRTRDGIASVAALRGQRPDMVITSSHLPGLDGFRLCTETRLHSPGPAIPLLLLSPLPDVAPRAQAVGATAFLQEPVADEALLVAVHTILSSLGSASGGKPPRLPAFAGPHPHAPQQGDAPPARSRSWAAHQLPVTLHELFHAGHSGRIAFMTASGRAWLDLRDGHPTRCRVPGCHHLAAQVLQEWSWVPAEVLVAAPRLAADQGPLELWLQHDGWLDAEAARRLGQEVLVRSLLVLASQGPGVLWRHESPPLEQPGHRVHMAAVLARFSPQALPIQPPSGDNTNPWLHAEPELEPHWALLDPTDERAGVRLLLLAGASMGDVLEFAGASSRAWLHLLLDTGLLTPRDNPPTAAEQARVVARCDVAPFIQLLDDDSRVLADADPHTLAENADALSRYHPCHLPPGLPPQDRQRAMHLYRRLVDARRQIRQPRLSGLLEAATRLSRPDAPLVLEMAEYAATLAEQANTLAGKGQFLGAAALLALALELEGEDAEVLALLGWCRHQAAPGDPSAGEPELRRALQLDPDNPQSMRLLASLLAARGEATGADALARRALLICPDLPGTRQLLA